MILPPFIPGIHWRRLRIGRWRFLSIHDVKIPTALRLPDASFRDAKGREWMQWRDNNVTIRKDYAWNGNSFAIDTRKNMLGSLVHDALYQFSAAPGFPMTRDQADLIYLGILRASGFMLAVVYYRAVKRFGAVFWQSNMGETMEIL
jgi:hypothetical protein